MVHTKIGTFFVRLGRRNERKTSLGLFYDVDKTLTDKHDT